MRRPALWVLGTLAYFAAIGLWVWWMKTPPKIQAPLAAVPLAEGNELRLIHQSVGEGYEIRAWENFGDRIRLPPGSEYYSSEQLTGSGLYLAFTEFDPVTQRFARPHFKTINVVEEGTSFRLPGEILDSSLASVYQVIRFPVVPRRSPTLRVEAARSIARGAFQFTLANPAQNRNAPKWDGKDSLHPPQRKITDGITVEVSKIAISEGKKRFANQSTVVITATPRINFSFPGMPENSFQSNFEWFDATGNKVTTGVLPFSEPVWGLRVKFLETIAYPFPPERAMKLGKVKVPAAGQVVTLTVPPAARAQGITDALLIGSGNYQWGGNKLLYSGPNGRTTVATLSSPRQYGGISASSWEIYLFSGGQGPKTKKSGLVRVNLGGVNLQSGSSGMSASGNARSEHWGSFRTKNQSVLPGAEIDIELVLPIERQVEFFLKAPPPPSK